LEQGLIQTDGHSCDAYTYLTDSSGLEQCRGPRVTVNPSPDSRRLRVLGDAGPLAASGVLEVGVQLLDLIGSRGLAHRAAPVVAIRDRVGSLGLHAVPHGWP